MKGLCLLLGKYSLIAWKKKMHFQKKLLRTTAYDSDVSLAFQFPFQGTVFFKWQQPAGL